MYSSNLNPEKAYQPGSAQNNVTFPETPSTTSTTTSGLATPVNAGATDLRSLSMATTVAASIDHEPNWPSGWRPWACLFGCFLLMFNSWGLVNAYGTFQSYYLQHLLAGHNVLELNLVGSTESFVVLILSFVVGRVLDAGHARKLIALGGVLLALGMFLLSVVNGPGHYGQGRYGLIWLTQGFIVGLGMACFFVSSSQVAATWFIKRKAIAIGIVASGASVAGLVYPMMTKFLITEVGFNNAVRYVATVATFTSILAFLFAVPNPAHQFRKPKSWRTVRVWVDTQAFRDPAFCWFTASICFVFLGFYAIFFNLEDWAASNGFAKKDVPPGLDIHLPNEVAVDAIRTFWLLCVMNASSTFGRLFSAAFSERFGALNIHASATAIGALLVLLLWTQANSLAPALAFVIIFGAVSGAIIGLPPASVAALLGRGDAERQARLGQWTGMMYSVAAVPALVGPVIAGALLQATGDYIAIQAWSGACLAVAACCMVMARIYAGKGRSLETLRGFGESISRVVTREKGEVQA